MSYKSTMSAILAGVNDKKKKKGTGETSGSTTTKSALSPNSNSTWNQTILNRPSGYRVTTHDAKGTIVTQDMTKKNTTPQVKYDSSWNPDVVNRPSGYKVTTHAAALPAAETNGSEESSVTTLVKKLLNIIGGHGSNASGATATPDATATPSVTATPKATATPGATATPIVTATPKATATPDVTTTPKATVTPGVTATPGATATPGVTAAPIVAEAAKESVPDAQLNEWKALASKESLTKTDRKNARQAMDQIEQLYPDLSLEGAAAMKAMWTVPSEIRGLYGTLKNRSDWRTGIGAGIMNSLGIDWLMDKLVAPGLEKYDKVDAGTYSMQNAVDTAAQDYPGASTAGNIAGTLLLASGAQQATKGLTTAATGAIKGLSSLPGWVQRAVSGMIQSGITFGALGAYQGVTSTKTKAEWDRQESAKADYYAEQGVSYEPIDYSAGKQAVDVLRKTGINTLGGIAGSMFSSIVGATGAYVLVKSGLQTPFMEALRSTLSGTAFAGGRILSTYWLYPKDARPSAEQIMQDFAVSFLFSVVTSFGQTEALTAQNRARLETSVKQMQAKYAETMSGAETVPEQVQAYEEILQMNKDIRAAISQNYYAGNQSGINDLLKALDAVDEQIGIRMAAANASGATAGGEPANIGAGTEVPFSGTEKPLADTEATYAKTDSGLAAPAGSIATTEPATAADNGTIAQQAAIGTLTNSGESTLQMGQEEAGQRYSEREQAAIVSDVEAAELPEADRQAVIQTIKIFTEQAAGALSDRGKQLTQTAVKAARQAADGISIAKARLQSAQTQTVTKLNKLYSKAQSAFQSAQEALSRADMENHAKAVTEAKAAMAEYQEAFQIEQAENAVRKAEYSEKVRAAQDDIITAAKDLQEQIPNEIASQMEAAANRGSDPINEQTAGTMEAPAGEVATNLGIMPPVQETAAYSAPAASTVVQPADDSQGLQHSSETEKRIRLHDEMEQLKPKPGELFNRMDQSSRAQIIRRNVALKEALGTSFSYRIPEDGYDKYLKLAFTDAELEKSAIAYEEAAIQFKNDKIGLKYLKDYASWLNSDIMRVYEIAKKRYGYATVTDAPEGGDAELRSSVDVRKYSRIRNELLHSSVPEISAVFSAIEDSASPAEETLTTPATTGIVEPQAAQEAPSDRTGQKANPAQQTTQAAPTQGTKGTFDLVGRILNPGGVPKYQIGNRGETSASAKAAGTPDTKKEFNLIARILGGNADGRQGRNASLLGSPVHRLQQGEENNRPESVGTDRIRSQAAGRNGSGVGYGSSDRATARGGQVSAGAGWNETNLRDLTDAEASINAELEKAGAPLLEPGDLVPYEGVDQESEHWINRMESLSGRKALLYTSKSGRTDIPFAFANSNREHVRYQPGRIMAFHFAHEIAENSKEIRAAGEKTLNTIGNESFHRYLKIKGAEGADAETQHALRKEFLCDAYGAVMFEVTTGSFLNEQLGISDRDYDEFRTAYIEHLASPAIDETKLDDESRGNLRAGGRSGGSEFSGTDVDLTGLDEAERAGITPATREEALTLQLTNPRNMMRYRNEIDEVFKGNFPERNEILLGIPPQVLQDHRMSNKPLYMTQSTAWKVAYPEGYNIGGRDMGGKHNLGIEVLKQLPEQLADPLAITNNTEMQKEKEHDSIVVWTDWTTPSGRSVIVPITINKYGTLGFGNKINSVFISNDKYVDLLKGSGILYTRQTKDIEQLTIGRRLMPVTEEDDVFTSIISQEEEKSNTSAENSQFSINGKGSVKFSSTDLIDPGTDPFAEEALRLYEEGIPYNSYMNSDQADWRVGKVLNGLWNSSWKVRSMQRALDLFENNISPVEYWEKNKTHFGQEGDQDSQVLKQLVGMYLRNDLPMGGRLGEAEHGQLETLLKDIGNARQYHTLKLSGMSPVRVFENIAGYRKENSVANIAANYADGQQLRRVYFDYTINQNASRATYMQAWRDKVYTAFKGGTVRESVLAQLLGEKIINEANVKDALFDSGHMLVRAADGWFVFDHAGQITAFCDGDTTFFRDPDTIGKQKEANKQSNVEKTAFQKARERLRVGFTRVDGSVIRVTKNGKNTVIHIPGIRNPVQIHNGTKPNAEVAIRTANVLSEFYAQAWVDQSKVLVKNGYPPAKYIEAYFPHMWHEESGLNAVIEQFVGYQPPTEIAGITGGFRPGKPWAAHLLERTGPLTEFNAIRGFNTYVQKASDVIYMTPVVQRLRQMESYLRTNAGDKFDESAHTALVEWLRKYTNSIANKRAELDRSAESLFGHEAFSMANIAMRLISRSAVQGNLSSAMSNFISYLTALPTLNAGYAAKATMRAIPQTMLAMFNSDAYDGFAEKVPFLKVRFDAYEPILIKSWQKTVNKLDQGLGWLFMAADRFATEAVARAKFDELRSGGMDEEEAARETSVYCVKIFADRSKGMAPVLFNNRVIAPFMQFQLEVANQMSVLRDLKWQGKAEMYALLTDPNKAETREKRGLTDDMTAQLLGDAPLTADAKKLEKKLMASGDIKKWVRLLAVFALWSLWGEFTRKTMGRDQTWNPYGMTKDFIEDTKDDGILTAGVNAGANTLEQLPYTSFATGGRIPIGTGIDKLATVAGDLYKGANEGNWDGIGNDALKAALAFTPGGGQTRKTITGVQTVKEGGYYTDIGELRYPVTEKDIVKTILFGPSAAAPEGYDWSDKLSVSKTDIYHSMVENGYDPEASYNLLKKYNSATNATKGLSILTADNDGDGKPDFAGKDIDTVAKIMGLSYDPKKDGSLKSWTQKAANDYIKNAQEGGVTATEKKNIDSIQRMMNILLGVN